MWASAPVSLRCSPSEPLWSLTSFQFPDRRWCQRPQNRLPRSWELCLSRSSSNARPLPRRRHLAEATRGHSFLSPCQIPSCPATSWWRFRPARQRARHAAHQTLIRLTRAPTGSRHFRSSRQRPLLGCCPYSLNRSTTRTFRRQSFPPAGRPGDSPHSTRLNCRSCPQHRRWSRLRSGRSQAIPGLPPRRGLRLQRRLRRLERFPGRASGCGWG